MRYVGFYCGFDEFGSRFVLRVLEFVLYSILIVCKCYFFCKIGEVYNNWILDVGDIVLVIFSLV